MVKATDIIKVKDKMTVIKGLAERGAEAKASHLFLRHIFVNFMEKEPCTEFCGVLIRFQDVIKLQSFEFSESVTLYPRMHKTFQPWFSFHFFG